MKNKFYILIFGSVLVTFLFLSCKKSTPLTFEEDQQGQPVFYLKGTLDSVDFMAVAGDSNLYMYSSYYFDSSVQPNPIYIFESTLKPNNCVVCPSSLKIRVSSSVPGQQPSISSLNPNNSLLFAYYDTNSSSFYFDTSKVDVIYEHSGDLHYSKYTNQANNAINIFSVETYKNNENGDKTLRVGFSLRVVLPDTINSLYPHYLDVDTGYFAFAYP